MKTYRDREIVRGLDFEALKRMVLKGKGLRGARYVADPNGIQVWGGGEAAVSDPGYTRPFAVSKTDGNPATPTEGRVTVALGFVEWHGPSGSLYDSVSERFTGDGTLGALTNGINIVYLKLDWSGSPVSTMEIAVGSSETNALTNVQGSTSSTVKPVVMATYNSTTKAVVINRVYHEGNWEPGSLYALGS